VGNVRVRDMDKSLESFLGGSDFQDTKEIVENLYG
jgi:hypothetical protein